MRIVIRRVGSDRRSRWVRDLQRFLPLKSQLVLSGNIRDLQVRELGGNLVTAPLSDVVAAVFESAGYAFMLRYAP